MLTQGCIAQVSVCARGVRICYDTVIDGVVQSQSWWSGKVEVAVLFATAWFHYVKLNFGLT
jgi:hypothetical protein